MSPAKKWNQCFTWRIQRGWFQPAVWQVAL